MLLYVNDADHLMGKNRAEAAIGHVGNDFLPFKSTPRRFIVIRGLNDFMCGTDFFIPFVLVTLILNS